MEVIRSLDSSPLPGPGCVVTIGQYDGVHTGHRSVIDSVRALASPRSLSTAVVTFDRHPASVVRPESAPKLLTDLDEKLDLLAATGVDYTVVVDFDEKRSREPAEHFVRSVLMECLNAAVVVVGEDFHFGHRRQGNVSLLEEMGSSGGFEVVGLDLIGLEEGGGPVSSTAIRNALADGRLVEANAMLGRDYEMRGNVVEGDRRGRELGFPTANVAVPEGIQLPADGIYAGWYQRPGGDLHPTAISLGRRPTFYDNASHSLLEAHLLEFEDDLYGESARVQFVARLRGEENFDSIDDLVAQIRRDCDQAKEILRE